MSTVSIQINAPALINAPYLFSRNNNILTRKPLFCHLFYKGDQHEFVFLSLGGHSSLNGAHNSRKEFAPLNGVHYSRKEFAPEKGGKQRKNSRIFSSNESTSIHHNTVHYKYVSCGRFNTYYALYNASCRKTQYPMSFNRISI